MYPFDQPTAQNGISTKPGIINNHFYPVWLQIRLFFAELEPVLRHRAVYSTYKKWCHIIKMTNVNTHTKLPMAGQYTF